MNKALAYIMNPEKTDDKMLVSSYGCAAETAAQEFEWTRKIAEQQGMNPVKIIARHVIQSFDVGEVSPELAHEIGKQFADEILGGKYEYVLTNPHRAFPCVDYPCVENRVAALHISQRPCCPSCLYCPVVGV